jgi:DNA-binding LacI/PurR family transcriptional regulator
LTVEDGMLARRKIIALTKATVSRVLANEVGVAPKKKRHVKRLAKLKKLREQERARYRAAG